jgi:hypothetical protein
VKRTTAIFGLLLALALPASAPAKNRTYAPPGNSGVNQYVESVPTAGGKKPANSVHAGGGSGGGGGGSSSSIPASTQQQFARQGAAGRAAIALAQATAPSGGSASARTGRHGSGRSGNGATTGSASPGTAPRTAAGFSPVSSLLKTFTGSTAGGLGALLPIILVVSAVGAMAMAIFRRRRET